MALISGASDMVLQIDLSLTGCEMEVVERFNCLGDLGRVEGRYLVKDEDSFE